MAARLTALVLAANMAFAESGFFSGIDSYGTSEIATMSDYGGGSSSASSNYNDAMAAFRVKKAGAANKELSYAELVGRCPGVCEGQVGNPRCFEHCVAAAEKMVLNFYLGPQPEPDNTPLIAAAVLLSTENSDLLPFLALLNSSSSSSRNNDALTTFLLFQALSK